MRILFNEACTFACEYSGVARLLNNVLEYALDDIAELQDSDEGLTPLLVVAVASKGPLFVWVSMFQGCASHAWSRLSIHRLFSDRFKSIPQASKNTDVRGRTLEKMKSNMSVAGEPIDFATGFGTELATLIDRNARNIVRTPELLIWRLVLQVVVALTLGSLFFQVEDDAKGKAVL
jgi:hypothetical protein